MKAYLILFGSLLAIVCAMGVQAESPPPIATNNPSAIPTESQVQTASTHPMKYLIALPKGWSPVRKWPVLIAPNAHFSQKEKTISIFAPERDAKNADFIIVAPFVINADPVSTMKEYRGAIADAISAADANTGDYGRDESARAKFDSEGVQAVIKDVQQRFHGEDKVFITGFSSSTHVAYLFLFTHPELLKGAIINSGVYLGRGVDEDHIPLRNSPERTGIGIKFIIGENDMGYKKCMENWLETKAQLLSYGHFESKMQTEVIEKENLEKWNAGHNWFPTRIMDFCMEIEQANK